MQINWPLTASMRNAIHADDWQRENRHAFTHRFHMCDSSGLYTCMDIPLWLYRSKHHMHPYGRHVCIHYSDVKNPKACPFIGRSSVYSIVHYGDVIMMTMASQITSLTIVYSTVYSGADQRKHQSSASLAFVRGIHRGPVNSPHKWPVTRKMFPFDDFIMFRRPTSRKYQSSA